MKRTKLEERHTSLCLETRQKIVDTLKARPKRGLEVCKELNYSFHYTINFLCRMDLYGGRRYDNQYFYWVKPFRILQNKPYDIALILSEHGSADRYELAECVGVSAKYLSAIVRQNLWLFEVSNRQPLSEAGRPRVRYSLKFDPFSLDPRDKPYPILLIDGTGKEV